MARIAVLAIAGGAVVAGPGRPVVAAGTSGGRISLGLNAV